MYRPDPGRSRYPASPEDVTCVTTSDRSPTFERDGMVCLLNERLCKRLLYLIRSHVLSSTPHEPEESSIEVPAKIRALPAAGRFVADRWIRLLTISALILVPCFWHRHIEAGDLGSHVYNAWLAELIEHGDAPGLRIADPSTN